MSDELTSPLLPPYGLEKVLKDVQSGWGYCTENRMVVGSRLGIQTHLASTSSSNFYQVPWPSPPWFPNLQIGSQSHVLHDIMRIQWSGPLRGFACYWKCLETEPWALPYLIQLCAAVARHLAAMLAGCCLVREQGGPCQPCGGRSQLGDSGTLSTVRWKQECSRQQPRKIAAC